MSFPLNVSKIEVLMSSILDGTRLTYSKVKVFIVCVLQEEGIRASACVNKKVGENVSEKHFRNAENAMGMLLLLL